MMPGAAVLAILVAGPAAAGWFGSPEIPRIDGMSAVIAGAVSINGTEARYAISSGDAGSPVATLDRAARRAGWQPEATRRSIPVPAGDLDLRSYRSGKSWLIQGAVRRRPGENGPAVAIQALFDRVPKWAGDDGEAPGREPAGWPRLSSARRLLHLAGRGFEAACYASPAAPARLRAEAERRLREAGWRTQPLGEAGLAAPRAGRPDTALWLRAEGRGTTFVLISTEEVR